MLRRNPRKVGRALSDWLRRHRGERVATVDQNRRIAAAESASKPLPRAARLRAAATVRVTPYQLRRELTW